MQIFGSDKKGRHSKSREYTADVENEYDQYYVSEERENEEEPAEKPRNSKRAGKIIVKVLIIIAILVALGFFAMQYFTEAPTTNNSGLFGDEDIEAGVTNGRYNGMYTFLVVGRDKVGNNTDTIMVGCLDVVNGKLNVINIPRDTLVNTGYNVKKINYIYPACVNNNKDAIGELKAAIEDMLGFGVDNYIVVDIEAAAKLINTIGGVEFDVPVDMHYDDPGQDLHININKGMQLLNGEQAVQVFRFRNTYAGGDIERISVQQSLLSAIASQTLRLGNIPNLGKIIDIVKNGLETDLAEDNIRFYAAKFLRLDEENVNFMTLPGNTFGSIFGVSYVYPYIDQWIDMVNEYINPWEKKVTVDNVNMLTYADGSFYSTTGEMPGGVSSFMFYSSSDSMANAQVYDYSSYISSEDDNT